MTPFETKMLEVNFVEKPADARSARRNLRPAIFLTLTVAVVVLSMVIYSGVRARATADVNLKRVTEQAAIPLVNVINPTSVAPDEELVLPGNTQAFTDAPIYARTTGYLKRWYYDIGAQVKQGDLLAEIETPEIDQQLKQARADLRTVQANIALAGTTAARFQALLQSGAVSQQETDQAVSNFTAQKAIVDAHAANVRRLEELQSFQKVYAPFDGVITARNTDIGALIDAGAAGPGKELFHLAAISTLRVYVAVPQVYARAMLPGATASLTLDELPGEVFHGALARNAHSIDTASRTLLVEVDVNNANGQLMPGAYVQVHLKLPTTTRSVTVPANTLLFRSEGLRVGVVRDGRAQLLPVTIGRDYGGTVEIITGLQPTDAVIVNPADSLVSGTPVRTNGQQRMASAQ